MKLKFFIIGSCQSGYMFKEKLIGNYANGNIEPVYQHQHDTFLSIMSNPYDIELKGVTSKYQWDFDHFAESLLKKDVITKIKETKPDYLVIDTYAEAACPIIKINDTTYITSNYYISSSSLYNQLPKERILEVNDMERFELFKKYFCTFIDTVRAECPNMKLILVKARSTSELYDSDEIGRTIFSYSEKVQALNERRDMYDKFILENIEDVRCLNMTDEYNLADTRIRDDYNYEVSHNHYNVSYYRRQYHKLQNIIISDMLGGRERTRYFNQAVCIRAYGDYPLVLLMTKMYKDFFKVYIHIDADSIGRDFTEEQISRLRRIPNVYVMTKYKAPKGSYNELLGWLELSDMAFSDKDVTYVHYVTSMDMPIQPVNRLYEYYEKHAENRCFLNCHANGDRAEMENVAAYTYRYYHYFYNEDERDANIKEMVDASALKQKQMGICRNNIGEFTEMYKGVVGGSLTRDAYEYCKVYVQEHPEYLEDIKFTRLRTEFFFHTILFNAKEFEDKLVKSVRGSKFDWTWDDKKKDYAELDAVTYSRLRQNSNTFFVRKVKSDNTEVLDMILKDVKAPYNIEK